MVLVVAVAALGLGALAGAFGVRRPEASVALSRSNASSGIHKIQHVVVIMQENRSFDTYFGTFPGADGIPMRAAARRLRARPARRGAASRRSTTARDVQRRRPARARATPSRDIDGGQMDGFVAQRRARATAAASTTRNDPLRARRAEPDVMGYHDAREIPNYWAYASNFVLQDHMFEPNASWSLPAHLFMVSEWSARCRSDDPGELHQRARSAAGRPPAATAAAIRTARRPIYAWTDLTYLLHKRPRELGLLRRAGHASPTARRRRRSAPAGPQSAQDARASGTRCPTSHRAQDDQLRQHPALARLLRRRARRARCRRSPGSCRSSAVSEHPPALVSAGQAYVTGSSTRSCGARTGSSPRSSWPGTTGAASTTTSCRRASTATATACACPGIVISPYARQGYIDHQTLSFDAYAKFIEDDFLGGQRLDPQTDGRPDPRPDVREDVPHARRPLHDFDFAQPPRPPLLLPPHPRRNLVFRTVAKLAAQ